MSDPLKEEYGDLAPHQASFVELILTTQGPKIISLEAAAGSGATFAICAAVRNGMASGRFNRVLFLGGSRAILEHAMGKVEGNDGQVACFQITSKTIKYFAAESPPGDSIWPDRGVFFASIHFVAERGGANNPLSVDWDLIVVDDELRVSNRAERTQSFLDQLVAHPKAVIVFASRFASSALTEALGRVQQDAIRVSWDPKQMRDWAGVKLEQPKLRWNTISYSMSDTEAAFVSQLEASREILIPNFGIEQAMGLGLLMHRAMSCMYALERTLMDKRNQLQIRRNELAHGMSVSPKQEALFDNDEEESQLNLFDDKQLPRDLSTIEGAIEKLDLALNSLESVESDTKFKTLLELVRSIHADRIAIVTQYASTVSYLETALKDAGVKCESISGRLTPKEGMTRLTEFVGNGGLLIATDASLIGVEMPMISHVIHYDLPMNRDQVSVRLSRFQPFGHSGVVEMFALVEENSILERLWKKILEVATVIGRSEDAETPP